MKRSSVALVSALAIAAALGGSTAWAEPAEAQMRVKVGDLNLLNGDGADRAFRRIQRAATTFCDVRPEDRSLTQQFHARKCRDRMTYLAVNKLDSRLVTARYERSGEGPPIQLASR
jgi:UrcA family protein